MPMQFNPKQVYLVLLIKLYAEQSLLVHGRAIDRLQQENCFVLAYNTKGRGGIPIE